MGPCAAPWYELNISAPDNNVSACCYYDGPKETWDDQPKDITWYWNGEGMKALRRLQAGRTPPTPNGCSNCFYFQQVLPGSAYYDFSPSQPPPGLSAAQAANWLKAKAEHAAGADSLECVPLRIYANFGYACNLSCTMCHQVPRRRELKRQIRADNILRWSDQLLGCLEVCVIGGEPFTIPEAIKFIRTFTADDRYESVRLSVFTNGTVVHKHWPALLKKKNLSLNVSLDSIGEGYEKIRAGGNWADVERNILMAAEIKARQRPSWNIATTANIQKVGMPYLGQYARWHVKHGIRSFFYDFISAFGVEDTFGTQNFLHNPHLVDDMPQWAEYFDDAISTYRCAAWETEAALLEQFRDRVMQSIERKADEIGRMRRQRGRNDWVPQKPDSGDEPWIEKIEAYAMDGKSAVPVGKYGELKTFAFTRIGDYFTTPFLRVTPPPGGGQYRVRLQWPRDVKPDASLRLAHAKVQSEQYNELEAFREFLDFGFGNELVLTGSIPAEVTGFRVLLTPLGEEITVLPKVLDIDLDPETKRGKPAARPLLRRLSEAAGQGMRRLSDRLRSAAN